MKTVELSDSWLNKMADLESDSEIGAGAIAFDPIPDCRKCGGDMRPSSALKDDTADMGIPDFAGNTVDSRGQTVTFKSSGRLHDCLKCVECGWSVL